ncbi:hypothetical protein ADL19_13440 [Streptomyces purpurogeneiscleroticus]|nr:hypothetical protein ADL19_13440 [Streptomyces purpurogeneiscleroticus]
MPRWLQIALVAALPISALIVASANRWEAVRFEKNAEFGWDSFYLLDRWTGHIQACTVLPAQAGQQSAHLTCQGLN